VEAVDIDEGRNAEIRFSLSHISNNGTSKFSIDENSGMLYAVGKLETGEQYSVTVQVSRQHLEMLLSNLQ